LSSQQVAVSVQSADGSLRGSLKLMTDD